METETKKTIFTIFRSFPLFRFFPFLEKKQEEEVPNILKKLAKIEHLPKDVADTVPIRGITAQGVIETYAGTFTKSYHLPDVNFSIATLDDQINIFRNYMDFLNHFGESTKWEFTIFKHEIEKKKTVESIRILPQKDGLNRFRQEYNKIFLDNLQHGNNSIQKDMYLTVAIEDADSEHAISVLKRIDSEVNDGIKKIVKQEIRPMSLIERLQLLYNIYNQDSDYRADTNIFDEDASDDDAFSLPYMVKAGLSVKDLISATSFDFKPGKYFRIGELYAKTLYLQDVPPRLTTEFMADLSDLNCNMLLSVTHEAIDTEDSIRMVKNEVANIEAKVTAVTKRNINDGIFGALPPELEKSQESARDLMDDITKRNQKLFFVTITMTIFARTYEELKGIEKTIESIANIRRTPIKPLDYQQEFAFNTSLPLCRNDLKVEGLYTTESAGVFIPFNSQEINQKNAVFYGLNKTTKSMLMYDRFTGNNYNGLIFGGPGSGKSLTAKNEMAQLLLKHEKIQVFAIDPQGEYGPLAELLGGQEIILAPGSRVYINPLDLDLSEDANNENDPVAMKVDFVQSLFTTIIGQGQLSPVAKSIIDKCVRKLYKPYIDYLKNNELTVDLTKCPTLSDLYQELTLLKVEKYEAGQLADYLSQYAIGTFDTFAHRTNVNVNEKFVVYNTKSLGSGMKELGLQICISDIWNRIQSNAKKGIYTAFYIDEFHILLESDATTLFLKRIWKMARKWLAAPTGIMQNTEDLIGNKEARAILQNTSFVLMMNSQHDDRLNLAELFNLSASQIEYITDPPKGHGLMFNGKVSIPFGFDFPKNTELYQAMSTSNDRVIKKGR